VNTQTSEDHSNSNVNDDVFQVQRKLYENNYEPKPDPSESIMNESSVLKSNSKLYEDMYTPDLQMSSTITETKFFKLPEKLYESVYPSDVHQTNDIFSSAEPEKTYFSNFTMNNFESLEKLNENICPPIIHQSTFRENVFKPETAHVPEVFHLVSPISDASKSQDIYSTDTLPSILPMNNFSKSQTIYPAHIFQSTSNVSDDKLRRSLFIEGNAQDVLFMNSSGDWFSEQANETSLAKSWEANIPRLTDDEIIRRVVKLVNSQRLSGGIDSKTVELKYRELHYTTLPKQWLNLIEERSVLYLEKLTACTILYPNRYFPMVPTIITLPALRFPNIQYFWNVYISNFENIACVWFRLADEDYDFKYDILQREINRHYSCLSKSIKNLDKVATDQLCAINYRNKWYRGKVLECDTKIDCVKCLLIDEGIIQNFPAQKIFPIHEKFTNTPALILQGQLSSLEKWENCNYVNCKIRRFLLDERNVKIKISKFLSNSKISMQIYLENNSQLLNLNSMMADLARTELTLPVLYANQSYDVIILSPAEQNSVQVQIVSPSLKMLEETLKKVADIMKNDKNLEQARVKSMFDLKLDKIYLARCEDGNWRRIQCKQFHLNKKVTALFIDTAEVKYVYLHDIFETSFIL